MEEEHRLNLLQVTQEQTEHHHLLILIAQLAEAAEAVGITLVDQVDQAEAAQAAEDLAHDAAMAKVSLRIQGATAAVEAAKEAATLSSVAAAAAATASSEASRHAGLRAAAASEAAANATRMSEAAASSAAMASAAATAATAEVTTADARLNWRRNMSLRLADGAIEEVAAAHADKLPQKIPSEVLRDRRAIFAASPDLWDKLGVPLEFRPLASKRLESLFWYVGSQFPGSTWVSESKHSRFARDRRGVSHRWFAIGFGGPLGLLKAAVLEGKDLQSEWPTKASRALMHEERLREASEAGLNCEVCNMPVLDPDDPQFGEKANEIAQLCHGGVRNPSGCPHICCAAVGTAPAID